MKFYGKAHKLNVLLSRLKFRDSKFVEGTAKNLLIVHIQYAVEARVRTTYFGVLERARAEACTTRE